MGARIAVLVSGSGTNLQALLDDEAIAPHIAVVLSDRPGVAALDRAARHDVEAIVVEPSAYPDRAIYTDAVRDVLVERSVDTVVLAGFMRVLGASFFEAFPDRVLNVHPALLPSFPGAHAVADALAWGVKVTGVTVHLVDEQVDHGPIVLQEADRGPRRRRRGRRWSRASTTSSTACCRPPSGRCWMGAWSWKVGRYGSSKGSDHDERRDDARPPGTAGRLRQDGGGRRSRGELVARGVALVSSGGTAATLREAGLPVTPVEEVTGSPEMLGGRVKTLHPAIHGGILADRRKQDHVDQLVEQGIEPFDLVVVNLYPFRETVARGAAFEETIEKIDIGGPAMVRAAAKNFASVGVVVDPGRYDAIVAELDAEGGLTAGTRRALAAAAYAHTAAYDAAVAGWFAQQGPPPRPRRATSPSRSRRSSGSPTRRSASSATARTRISEAPSTGSRRLVGRVRGRQRARRARTCRSTTGSTRTRPTSSWPRCRKARR